MIRCKQCLTHLSLPQGVSQDTVGNFIVVDEMLNAHTDVPISIDHRYHISQVYCSRCDNFVGFKVEKDDDHIKYFDDDLNEFRGALFGIENVVHRSLLNKVLTPQEQFRLIMDTYQVENFSGMTFVNMSNTIIT